MFSPANKISPLSTGSSRLMERSNVDFPEPDGPMTTTVSFAATDMLQVFKTCTDPKLLLIPRLSGWILVDKAHGVDSSVFQAFGDVLGHGEGSSHAASE